MAKSLLFASKPLKAIIYFLFLAITLRCATSARLLDEVDPQPHVIDDLPDSSNPASTASTLPSGQFPAGATAVGTDEEDAVIEPPIPEPKPEAPVVAAQPVDDVAEAEEDVPPVVAPVVDVAPETGSTTGSGSAVGASATSANAVGAHTPKLSFYMHDILGGSHPSARVVTGIIADSELNGIPFSKTYNNFFPVSGATPLINTNNINNFVNRNNFPLITGLNGGQSGSVLQNTATSNVVNGNDNQPFVSAGQLPTGASLQQLMFGSITVVDDELTESHELGSGVIGKAQGFYLASSLDGTSHTIAVTTLFHGGDHHEVEDTISFFGVHRAASHVSHIAVVGGTGKYEYAQGYATIETVHMEDQHTTDGVDTIAKIDVYLY